MKGRWRLYMLPRIVVGPYGGFAQDYIEVTNDVVFNSIGAIDQSLDNTAFEIGVFRTSSFSVKLLNWSGKYFEYGTGALQSTNSIFTDKRTGSLLRITWTNSNDDVYAGLAYPDISLLGEEIAMFEGIINDENASFDIETQTINFTILGRESALRYSAVNSYDSTHLGLTDQFSGIWSLNAAGAPQYFGIPSFTGVPSVSIASGTVGSFVTDGGDYYDYNKNLLEVGNLIMIIPPPNLATYNPLTVQYIRAINPIIRPRTTIGNVTLYLYGQGSNNGPENIISIKEISSGIRKVFNYWTIPGVAGPPSASTDSTSISNYGTRKREFSPSWGYSSSANAIAIRDSYLAEYKDPKLEFKITTPVTYESLGVQLLDKISIDYPRVSRSNGLLHSKNLWDFRIQTSENYKVMAIRTDIQKSTITFSMRAV